MDLKIEKKYWYFLYGILGLIIGVNFLFKDWKIEKEDLIGLEVVFDGKPIFYDGKNPSISIKTLNYLGCFVASGSELKAFEIDRFLRESKGGDQVIVYIKKEDKGSLNEPNFFGNYSTGIYGLKNGFSTYFDLELRNIYEKQEHRFGWIIVFFGISSLIFFIFFDKMIIRYNVLIGIVFCVTTFVILFWNNYETTYLVK